MFYSYEDSLEQILNIRLLDYLYFFHHTDPRLINFKPLNQINLFSSNFELPAHIRCNDCAFLAITLTHVYPESQTRSTYNTF